MNQQLPLSPFQRKVLAVPEDLDLALLGGRGSSKSHALAFLALRHIEQYGERARVLYVRRTHKGCADFQAICLDLFGSIYGTALRFNAQEGVFRVKDGFLEINQLETAADYAKYQGRSFTLLLGDELGNWPSPELFDRLRSNLRGPKGMPLRTVIAANSADVGQMWLARRYAFRAAPWTPFVEPDTGRMCVYAPSTFLDNPFIDQEAYKRQLIASCASDEALLRAWLLGDFTVARGAFFGACLEEGRNAVGNWKQIPKDWVKYLAHDWGHSAPSVTYVIAKSPGGPGPDGKFYPRNSLVLVDELATNEPGSLEKGMGYVVPVLSERIIEMCKRWKIRPEGVADDAIFAKTGHSTGSISDEFRAAGVYFTPAKKADRITGWNIMRRLLAAAGALDSPGLYIARQCVYFWSTVPHLARDPKKIEDVDSRLADHAADACRYGVLRLAHEMQKVKLSGV